MPTFNLFAKNIPNSLKTFRAFEIIFAIVCISIPVVLRWIDAWDNGFRSSISAYFDVNHSYLFGMLMCIPAMLFIFNGAVFFRKEFGIVDDRNGQWYNLILGFGLLGVICFNCKEFGTLHNIFAGIFFIGNAITTALFKLDNHRLLRMILALLTILTLIFGWCFKSLLWGEWLSLTVIGIHFILVADGRISYALIKGEV